jgi:hypothetical protein|tara:strand:+ start:927 stop:1310 length:384 start_codon:yes stop_codon:yes gene_type:complete
MKTLLASLILFGIIGCSISPKELDKLYSSDDYYSPVATIKCMQMGPPQRPFPINDKGETRESYDQDDCVEDTISKNMRELTFDLGASSIDLKIEKDIKKLPDDNEDSIDDIDIEAIEEKVLYKKKKD